MPRAKQSGGRATSKQPPGRPLPQQSSGRYTPPIPRAQRKSPPWFPFVILGLFIGGLVVIIGNYAGIMPGGVRDWYLIGGILAIVAGLVMATYYH